MEPRPVKRAFEMLAGKPAWQVKKGHGSFLTFEFGDPSLVIREPMEPESDRSAQVNKAFARRLVTVRGQWHLWIYCCNWIIEFDGHELSNNESPDSTIEEAASALDGQCIESASVKRDCSSIFRFDLGGVLKTRPYEEEMDSDQWKLYEPSGEVFEIRSDGTYSHSPGDAAEENIRRVPLFSGDG